MANAHFITLLNLLARAAQLLLFLVIGNRFGVTEITDTVLLLQAPLLILMSVAIGVADVVVMPAMHRAINSQCPAAFFSRFRNIAIVSIMPLAIIAVVIGMLITEHATLILALILLPMPVFTILSGIHVGILNSAQKHGRAALGPLYGGVLAILVLLILPLSTYALACSLLSFEIGRYFGLAYHSRELTAKYIDNAGLDNKLLIWALRNVAIQAIGSLLLALNLLVDYLFASKLSVGAISLVEYASRLWNIVPLLLIGGLTVSYARMSKLAADSALSASYVHNTAARLGFYAIMISIVAMLLTEPVIALVYGFGSMSDSNISRLSALLIFYLVGSGPFLAGMVYVRAHSANGRAIIITITAALGVLVNIVGNMLFIPVMGLNGIGLATSLTYIFTTILLAYAYFRQN